MPNGPSPLPMANIVPSYEHYVACAHPPGRVHRAVPSNQTRRLRSHSCIIDGEAVAYAFDLIELNGDDMRRDALEVRKATLRSMLAKAGLGLRFNEHMEGDGPTVFAHACKMGLEGIVSKRKDSMYRSGRSPDWLKMKNVDAPAVKREAEEDWGKRGRR
jgi:ATP-dependent DNA ligase